MTVQLAPAPVFQGTGFAGLPLPGGKLFSFQAGTSTPQATYTDSTQLSQNTNPVILNANGQANVWLVINQTYKLVLQDFFGNQIWSVDNIPGGISLNLTQQSLGAILYPPIPAEIGISIVNNWYPPFYVERYGADPTGVSDSGVGFRAACTVASNAGGAKIYALGSLYNFITWDTLSFLSTNNLALFCLPSNTELVGGGMFSTSLRVSNTARIGMYAGGANRTHIIGCRSGQTGQYIHDVQFDYNGIVQQSATDFCYFIRTVSGGCTIERTYATQAPITNGFVDGSTQAPGALANRNILRNNWWQDSGPNMTGNVVNSDLSYAYIQAPFSIAENNRFYNNSGALGPCGGIEFHSIGYQCRGNTLRNLWPALYLGVQDGVTVSQGSIVESNYIGFCVSGIFIIDQHDGLKITKNFFEANIDAAGIGFGVNFGDISAPFNGTTGVTSAGTQTALSIIDNTFDMTNYRQGTPRSPNVSNSINLSVLNGCEISHNKFVAATPNVIILQGVSSTTGSNGSAGAMNDVVIQENEFINCTDAGGVVGYFNLLATSAAGWGTGSLIQDVFIRNNSLLRSRTLSISNAFCLIVTGGGSFNPTMTNVRWESNDLININPATDIISAGASVIQNGANFTAQAISTSGTINTAGVTTQRCTVAAPSTAVIMQAGTVANQICTVVNESGANSITMDVAGNSHVADGASCVIAALTQKTFYWDIGTLLWYHN